MTCLQVPDTGNTDDLLTETAADQRCVLIPPSPRGGLRASAWRSSVDDCRGVCADGRSCGGFGGDLVRRHAVGS